MIEICTCEFQDKCSAIGYIDKSFHCPIENKEAIENFEKTDLNPNPYG